MPTCSNAKVFIDLQHFQNDYKNRCSLGKYFYLKKQKVDNCWEKITDKIINSWYKLSFQIQKWMEIPSLYLFVITTQIFRYVRNQDQKMLLFGWPHILKKWVKCYAGYKKDMVSASSHMVWKWWMSANSLYHTTFHTENVHLPVFFCSTKSLPAVSWKACAHLKPKTVNFSGFLLFALFTPVAISPFQRSVLNTVLCRV